MEIPPDPIHIQMLQASETHHGAELCKQKVGELLEHHRLPRGLLPLDPDELRVDRGSGFVWIKLKSRTEHKFRKIDRLVSFEPVITFFLDDRRVRKITGVRAKELFVWFSVGDMHINGPDFTKITFTNPTGISRTFPVSAFDE